MNDSLDENDILHENKSVIKKNLFPVELPLDGSNEKMTGRFIEMDGGGFAFEEGITPDGGIIC